MRDEGSLSSKPLYLGIDASTQSIKGIVIDSEADWGPNVTGNLYLATADSS